MTSRGDFNQDIVVRFAPSPNGLLHLGHAYAALFAHDYARDKGGKFLLRIEDIDIARSKIEFIDAIFADMRWLGISWDDDVIFQSERLESYALAGERLKQQGLLFACFCTRSGMREAQQVKGLKDGPDGPVYPGTCRHLDVNVIKKRMKNEAYCWRLNMEKAIAVTESLTWHDERTGEQLADPGSLGDVVIIPKEAPTSYHLAVTVDDARDGITHVVRGSDLFASTHVHRLLQALLDLPTPRYVHHPVLLEPGGQKLSKSRESSSLSALREQGEDGQELAQELRKNIFPVGITLSKD